MKKLPILSNAIVAAGLGLALSLISCNKTKTETTAQTTTTDSTATTSSDVSLPARAAFQDTINGKAVDLFVLKNQHLQAAITNYGGRVVSLLVPDKTGKLTDV